LATGCNPYETVSDSCLTSNIMARTRYFWWDVEYVWFVLDQHV